MGGLELVEGNTYLLFLDYHENGYWLPKMLSYAAFEQDVRDGKKVLVPFGLGKEVIVVQNNNTPILSP